MEESRAEVSLAVMTLGGCLSGLKPSARISSVYD